MPMGTGTYGNKRGRPPILKAKAKNKTLTDKQKKNLPKNLQKAILKKKKGKK